MCRAYPLGAEPFPRASCSPVGGPFAITRGPHWARLLCLESLPGGRQLSGICHLGSGRPGSHPDQLAWSPHLPPHPTSPCPSGSVSDSSYGLVLGGQRTSTGTLKCPARLVRRSQHRAVDARRASRWRRLAQPAGLGRSSTPAWLCLVRDTDARIPP